MNVYIKHRFLLLLPVLLGITFFTFVLMQLPADDTVDMMYKASGAVSETVKAAARAELDLQEALRQLNPAQRQVMMLLFAQELKPSEAAKRLGCSVRNVTKHRLKALDKLRGLL